MTKFLTFIGSAVVVVVGVIILAILMAYPTKWAVNYLFTPGVLFSLFGTAKISVWQALVLNFIGGTLFKGGSSSSSSK